MFEIMLLSGQEYVDEYASKVKSGDVRLGEDEAGGTTVELGIPAEPQRKAG
jgi:hypothetical protein